MSHGDRLAGLLRQGQVHFTKAGGPEENSQGEEEMQAKEQSISAARRMTGNVLIGLGKEREVGRAPTAGFEGQITRNPRRPDSICAGPHHRARGGEARGLAHCCWEPFPAPLTELESCLRC